MTHICVTRWRHIVSGIVVNTSSVTDSGRFKFIICIYIYVSQTNGLVSDSIDSGNGLAPNRRQAITRINADLLPVGLLKNHWNFNRNSNTVRVLCSQWQPFCSHLSVFRWLSEGFRITIIIVPRIFNLSAPCLGIRQLLEKYDFHSTE